MPLPFAHGFLGASIVAAIHPKPFEKYYFPVLFGAFLANAADFDFALVFLFNSKEFHRGFTHSIFFAVLVIIIFLLILGWKKHREAVAYGLAFASHFILDFVTTKIGGGLELYFPFSKERFGLRWFGLSEVPSKMSVIEIFQTIGLEIIIFAPLFLLVFLLKRKKDEARKLHP
ncbi:MAG TPA: metal-dependent hydrolase [Pyrinomonadaceae bacterium]|nr:metal-dependent hydrolase [Pyrinomonadaceae bacterium]